MDVEILMIVENKVLIVDQMIKSRQMTVSCPHYVDTLDKKEYEHLKSGSATGHESSPDNSATGKKYPPLILFHFYLLLQLLLNMHAKQQYWSKGVYKQPILAEVNYS